MSAQLFDDLTDVYEAMIDWPKRLANESPFYRRWFERVGAKSVLDAACGTGRHAALFHSWGMRVEGADLSTRMIQKATADFGAPTGLQWVIRGFDEPVQAPEPFDVAICVGNSLALAEDTPTVERAVRQLFAAVRPGGLVVVQVLNLRRMADGPCLWQKAKRVTLPRGEVQVVKGVHRCETRAYVDLVLLDPPSGALLHSESVPFLGLQSQDLDRAAREAGAAKVEFFGSYQDDPYNPATSVDLIMVALVG
jgi:SAM-dependent methyltransferase